jgi:DNA-binding CsgD family transcriptional regulator
MNHISKPFLKSIIKQMFLNFKFQLLILLSLTSQNLISQQGIKGQIVLDTTIWSPVAYLSLISDFDKMNTMTSEMIIEKADIDKSGRFGFRTIFLPKEDKLYRIHIAKRSDPPASLIIGGRDENYLFIIANSNSEVFIKDTSNTELLGDVIISGYYPNQMLQQIDEISSYLDTTNFNGSPIKTELVRSTIFENLRIYADTCSNPLIALYALYKSNFQENYSVNQQYFKDFLTKWKLERSTYFDEFRKQIQIPKIYGKGFLLLIGSLLFISGFLVCYFVLNRFKKKLNPMRDLSVQERKIFSLIIEGKSNKEISDNLNIGMSTVKSHVNSIYSKLDINSRKDILNLNLDS